MSLDSISLLTEDNDQCPGCHGDFSPIPESDGARTYLSCGHSVCWKCIQTEWCKTTTNDVDLVNCPLCNVEVLICFDGQDSTKTEEHPLESSRNELLQKPHIRQQQTTSVSNIQSTPGCSDVLMCQSVDGFVTHGNFPDMPLSVADSIINIAEMGVGINFPTQDQTESFHDRSWSLDIMNFQDILEKNDFSKHLSQDSNFQDILEKNNISQHLSQDSIFSDHSDSDMGSVQDILKIANLPGESLLDDNSLNAIFLPDNSNDTPQSNENLKNSVNNPEISTFSHILQPTPTPLHLLSQPSPQGQTDSSFGGVQIHINEAVNNDNYNNEVITSEERRLLESLKADQFYENNRSRGRRQYNSRGRGRGRGRKRKVMSSLSDMDQINSETLSAVASIQDNCIGYPSMQERPKSEKLISLKENLHQRFYPKSNRRSYSDISLEFPPEDRRFRKTMFVPKRDEVAIPDMQMVKIVSDVKLPEKKEQPPAKQEDVNNDIHNYGYVKNYMLPNGNEIKNLYVVPKTWLNNDEVEVQFAPSDQNNLHQAGQRINTPVETSVDCQPHSCAVSQAQINALPTLQPLRQHDTRLSCHQQTLLPEDNHKTNVQNSSPTLLQEATAQAIKSEAISETNLPKMISERTKAQMISASAVPSQLCDNANVSIVKTTIGKSLTPHTPKVIKVWSEDTDSRSSDKEVHIANLPQHDDLISGDNFETEMVHVRYEINDDQIVFIPESEDGHSSNEKDTSELTEKKNGPLLILTVQDNNPVSTELCGVEAISTSEELKPDTDTKERPSNTGRKEKSMILKSILQSDDFVSPSTIQMSIPDHRPTVVKRSVSASDVSGLPCVSVSTSLDSSSCQLPTASNSDVSCQRLFSSPESVRPKDIQEWYKSHENSHDSKDNSKLVMQPWGEFGTGLMSTDDYDFSIDSEADIDLPLKEDKRMENLIIKQTQDFFGKIITKSWTKSTSTQDLLECNHNSINDHVDGRSLEHVHTDMRVTSTTFTHNEAIPDGTDYGSPPELERMIMLPQSSTPDPNTSHVSGQNAIIPSGLEFERSFESHDKKTHETAELTKQNGSVTHAVKDECQKDQLETVLNHLYDLSKESETKSHIHMLICQIYKIKEMNKELDEDHGLQNCQRLKIVDMIVNQVSSIIACETVVHFIDENAGIYSKVTEESLCKQKRLLKKVVEKGVDLITNLTGEYEKTVDKEDDSNLEASTSGCEESQRQAPVEYTACPLLKQGCKDILSENTMVLGPVARYTKRNNQDGIELDTPHKSQAGHENMQSDHDSNEQDENNRLEILQESQDTEENAQRECHFVQKSQEPSEYKVRRLDTMLESQEQEETMQEEKELQDEIVQGEQSSFQGLEVKTMQKEQSSVLGSQGQDDTMLIEQNSMQGFEEQNETMQREQGTMQRLQDETMQRELSSIQGFQEQDETVQRELSYIQGLQDETMQWEQDPFLQELQERDENKNIVQESVQELQEEGAGIQPKYLGQLVDMNSDQLDETGKSDEYVEEQHDDLDTDSLEESSVGNGNNVLHMPQDLSPVSMSTSRTSPLTTVSNVALNVEIGSTTSNESVLPSLSEVLRGNCTDQGTSQIVRSEETRKLDREEDKENCDSRIKNGSVNGDDGDDDDDDDNGDDDGDDNDDYVEVEDEDGSKNGEEEQFQPQKRSYRQSGQRNNKKRKLLCLYDEDEADMIEQTCTSTPKKRRGNQVQNVATSSKANKTNKKPGRKKKKGKTKDIYASSSEEVIPAPVKRGFQYTEECFKVFNIVYNHERSDPFCKEIRSAEIPDYYKVVKRAMWLDLIAQKLRTGKYERLEQYVADMRLVFENSRRFNKNDSEIYESGLICEKLFEVKLAEQFPDKTL